ncbi:cytochrome c oxidase subunit 5b-1, mitochondrial-like isoform X2 [Macadamia integrifolia]|uniref:cytochrome c oxidase subunit 5b-1, mitochondrial-like isoform X2 n=1 Tax=Macadamia integrifolia TaxID=60698 RepID=UPI001C4E3EF3|nr:cytochrome c oxidase subunit 5b-1, mitochondrial-like isoform X2 [Macadamia integrifolia]
MWRRASSHLQTLVPWRSALNLNRSVIAGEKALRNRVLNSGSSPSAFQRTAPLFSNQFSSESGAVLSNEKKRVEDVMPIATGHEREELEAELEGRRVLEIDYPEGPFGTKEAPSIIKSYFDKRIVGCPGGEGEDEHDVVWFWLEKGKPHECPVCTQYFELEVVGPGGPPDGHGDDDHHH